MKGRLTRWAKDPGFWSLMDQSAVSLGNFVTTILLARVLVPAEYGVYALLFALMLFMYSLHSAVILYGLSLHGAAGSDAELRPLAGGSSVLTAALGTCLGAGAGVVAIFFHQGKLAVWVLLAFLFWQLQEALRRALMSRLRHRDAVWGDALSYLGQAAIVAYLFVAHRLTLAAAFQVMAATSAAAWLLQAAQLKLRPQDFRGSLGLLHRFWSAGRWALLTKIMEAFLNQTVLWLLALAGMAEVASFQSVLNLLRLTNPVMFAIGSVVLPSVAAQRHKPEAALHSARRYSLFGALVLLPYFGFILVFPGVALRLLYGAGSAYTGLALELRVLVVGSAFSYASHIVTMYFFGLARSDIALWCESVSAAISIASGLVLIRAAGVLGAAIAYDLTYAAAVAAFLWFLRNGVPTMAEANGSIRAASATDPSLSGR